MNENTKKTFTTIIAVSIIVIGVLILLQKYLNNVNLWVYIWPFIPITLGLMMIKYARNLTFGGRSFFCVFGCMVSMTGLMVLFSVIFTYWNIWYYGWTLIVPTSYGIGSNIVGMYSKNSIYKGQGNRTIFLGIVFFILGFGLFEYVSQFNRIMEASSGKIMLGYILICLGIYILVPSQFDSKSIFEDAHSKIRRRRKENGRNRFEKDDIQDEDENVVEDINNEDSEDGNINNEKEKDGLVEDFLTE